jgi:hypothetical protein
MARYPSVSSAAFLVPKEVTDRSTHWEDDSRIEIGYNPEHVNDPDHVHVETV